MNQASADLWPVLLPVIVGGLLALLPGAAVQIVTHILSRRAAREDRRRQRLEQLIFSLQEYEDWLDRDHSEKVYGIGAPVSELSPWVKITAIATMDFPNVLPDLDKVEYVASQYRLWINKAKLKRLQGQIAELSEGLNEVYMPFKTQINAVQNKLRQIAAKL